MALQRTSTRGGKTNGLVHDQGPSISKTLPARPTLHPIQGRSQHRRRTILPAPTTPLGSQTFSGPSLHQHPVQRRSQHRGRTIFPVPTIPLDYQISSGLTVLLSTRILPPNQLQPHSPNLSQAAPSPFLTTLALGLRVSLRLPTPNSTVNRHRIHPSRPLSRTVPHKHNHHSLPPPSRIRSRPIRPTTPLMDGQRLTRTSI